MSGGGRTGPAQDENWAVGRARVLAPQCDYTIKQIYRSFVEDGKHVVLFVGRYSGNVRMGVPGDSEPAPYTFWIDPDDRSGYVTEGW